MLANMEMVLAKSSLPIARRYAELVEDRALANSVMARIEDGMAARPVRRCWRSAARRSLLEHDPRLMASIRSRLPYVDALNHLQVDLLRRRRAGDASADIHAGIHMSINGVSAGLRNSG